MPPAPMARPRRASSASKKPCRWRPCRPPAPSMVLDTIRQAYPQFIDGGNVLQTGLNNMGAIFHPALTLLNCRLDRSDPRRLPVLYRRRDPLGGARAGSAGPRAGDGGLLAGHPRAHGHGMAETGLRHHRRRPATKPSTTSPVITASKRPPRSTTAISSRMCR